MSNKTLQYHKLFYNFFISLAEYRLVGFISHMGASTLSGHYVCHIKKGDQWIIYNDEKVAVSENPPRGLGYLYLYARI